MALDVHDTVVRDETRFDRQGNATKYKVVTFWIGNNGPFVEHFTDAEYSAAAVQAKQQQLKTSLALIGAS